MCMWKDLIRKTNHGQSLWTKAQVIWCGWFLQILTSRSPSPALVLSPFYTSPTPFHTAAGVSCSIIFVSPSDPDLSITLSLKHTRSRFPISRFINRGVQHVACCSLAFDPHQSAQRWVTCAWDVTVLKEVCFLYVFISCMHMCDWWYNDLSPPYNNSSPPPHGYTLFLKLLGKTDLFSTNQKCCWADNNAGDE